MAPDRDLDGSVRAQKSTVKPPAVRADMSECFEKHPRIVMRARPYHFVAVMEERSLARSPQKY